MKEDTWKLIWSRNDDEHMTRYPETLEFTDLAAAIYFRDNICVKDVDTHSIRIKNGDYDSTLIVSEFESYFK